MGARDATGKMSTMRLYIKGKNTALSAGRPLAGAKVSGFRRSRKGQGKMRLIDAEKVKQGVINEMSKAELNSPVYCTLECVAAGIDSQSTAYDVDSVVQQLEGRAKEAHAKLMGACCYMEFEKYSQQYSEIKACLGIVKAGAINGDAQSEKRQASTWQAAERMGEDGRQG